ncbi:MAG: TrbC/VirB2 family protein [Succinivibrio sp.]|nr:TrbC/VirB2 family protein [Succinivibrio sp.]
MQRKIGTFTLADLASGRTDVARIMIVDVPDFGDQGNEGDSNTLSARLGAAWNELKFGGSYLRWKVGRWYERARLKFHQHRVACSVFLNTLMTYFGVCMLVADADAATGGSGATVQSKLETILTVVQGCGTVVLVMAICWAGYKIMWLGNSLREVSAPLLGAILFASATWLAGILL